MSILIKINSRIQLKYCNEDSLVFLIDNNRTAVFYTQTPKTHKILLDFIREGEPLEALHNQDSADPSTARLLFFIDNLKKNGLVEYYFKFNILENVIVRPKSHRFKETILISPNFTLQQCPYVLSRFAYFRREKDEMIVECPLAAFRAVINTFFLPRFLQFINGKKTIQNESFPIQEEKTWTILINLLISHSVIHPVHEIETECLQFWEFHDLLFHSYSRRGCFDDNACFGPTYRLQKKLDKPKTFKNTECPNAIKLHKPNINELKINDMSFSNVLESRRSIRNYSTSKKITIEELGEFLYRSIGIREVIETPKQDAIFRPYPGAGAIHEIDFYLLINACEGIESGIYYYQPVNHELCRKDVDIYYFEKIISNAKAGMGGNSNDPHIVFVLTSRFNKIAWKYEKMSYRCTLISMGAIFQTMSLVATSMDLASCIVGSGDSSLFGEALGINSLEEGAVGEFVLGVPFE